MDRLPKDQIFEYNKGTLEAVRKTFDLDKPGVMKNAVDILEQWVQQQNHFTNKNLDRRYLETTLIISKGSLERAKSRIDRGCTLRTLMPHLFNIYDVRHFYNTDLKDIRFAALPKMTADHERVYILRNVATKLEDTSMPNFVRSLPIFCEYLRRNDYATNYYAVLDYMDVNLMELASKLTINIMQEIVAYCLDCCGFRLKGIYFVSSSKLVDVIVKIFKQVLSAKLGQRLHVLRSREAVKDVLDENILPKEYGGTEKSLDDLFEQWMDVLNSDEHIQYLKEINSSKTDEARRENAKFNEEYLGMPGSFRKLDVD